MNSDIQLNIISFHYFADKRRYAECHYAACRVTHVPITLFNLSVFCISDSLSLFPLSFSISLSLAMFVVLSLSLSLSLSIYVPVSLCLTLILYHQFKHIVCQLLYLEAETEAVTSRYTKIITHKAFGRGKPSNHACCSYTD